MTAWFRAGVGKAADDPTDKFFDVTLQAGAEKLGMKFIGHEVTWVAPGLWASREGIEMDDEIHEVNGVGFKALKDQQKMDAFQQPRPIKMKMRRPKYRDEFFAVECNARAHAGTGMRLGMSTVVAVEEHSWAEEAGLQVGDMVLEVNGRRFTRLKLEQFTEALQSRPLRLHIRRPHVSGRNFHPLESINAMRADMGMEPVTERSRKALTDYNSSCSHQLLSAHHAHEDIETTVHRATLHNPAFGEETLVQSLRWGSGGGGDGGGTGVFVACLVFLFMLLSSSGGGAAGAGGVQPFLVVVLVVVGGGATGLLDGGDRRWSKVK